MGREALLPTVARRKAEHMGGNAGIGDAWIMREFLYNYT